MSASGACSWRRGCNPVSHEALANSTRVVNDSRVAEGKGALKALAKGPREGHGEEAITARLYTAP